MIRMRKVFNIGLVVLSPWILWAQTAPSPEDALLDMLVWGTHMAIDPQAYPDDLRIEVEAYLRRAAEYRPSRPPPVGGEAGMIYAAQVGYERRLAGLSAESNTAQLAEAYVASLRPCYEWEGFHDCPERDALFADEYQAAHPTGPFRVYLPLLSAHRWLCTAEAYDDEQRPEDAARSRRFYEERIEAALQSEALLIRRAAERLAVRAQCFAPR